jgi:DNA-directed RNA polymerase subunit RPC12/RpoP
MTPKRCPINEACPECASRDVTHEVEFDDEGNKTADYWQCEDCGARWAYSADWRKSP